MLRSDETRISSHLRHGWSSARRGMGSARSYGAKEKADGGAGLGFDVVALLQALPDHERMRESNERAHHQLRSFARINRLELAAVNTVPQDQFDDPVHDIVVRAHRIPAVLDCGHDELVDAVLSHQVLLVVGQDLEDKPFDALRGWGLRARDRPGRLLDLR